MKTVPEYVREVLSQDQLVQLESKFHAEAFEPIIPLLESMISELPNYIDSAKNFDVDKTLALAHALSNVTNFIRIQLSPESNTPARQTPTRQTANYEGGYVSPSGLTRKSPKTIIYESIWYYTRRQIKAQTGRTCNPGTERHQDALVAQVWSEGERLALEGKLNHDGTLK